MFISCKLFHFSSIVKTIFRVKISLENSVILYLLVYMCVCKWFPILFYIYLLVMDFAYFNFNYERFHQVWNLSVICTVSHLNLIVLCVMLWWRKKKQNSLIRMTNIIQVHLAHREWVRDIKVSLSSFPFK